MRDIEYQCITVQQTPDSKPFYLISCSAIDLLKWSDVPRSKEGFMAGYQRLLDQRHVKITEFFEKDSVNNIIPNAIIVAVNENKVSFEKGEGNSGLLKVNLTEFDFEGSLKNTLADFEARLSQSEKDSIKLIDSDLDCEDVESEDVDSASPPESYLAELTSHLRKAVNEPESLTKVQQSSIKDYVEGRSKPGLILDGQHRVFGAKEVEEFDVFLPVIIIPGLAHMEQVFQFYVLNNKAKPLNRTHLRRIISTSLGTSEIDALYSRFKQAGVEAKTAEWTHKMNNDLESPFRGLIDMGHESGSGIINENVAFQVVSKFMLMHNKYKLLVKDVPEWNINDNTYRLEAFYALWKAIKSKYPDAWVAAEKQKGQLFYKVSLLVLQEYILDAFNADMIKRISKNENSVLSDCEELYREVGFALHMLPEKFFTEEWKVKGLDTSRGHSLVRDSINKVIQNQGKNIRNLALFREQLS
jgi:DGQHR domain-containing protein